MPMLEALGRALVSPFEVLIRQRGTIELFVRREIRGRYVNSVLGLAWAVVHPLALLALYTFVFSHVMQVRFTGDSAATNFPLYLFCGMLPWLAFSDGLARASSVLMEQTALIKKVVFPTEILPASAVISALVTELVGLVVLLPAVVVFAGGLGWSVLALPVIMVFQFLFTMGLAWFLACAGVAVRDLRHLLGVALTLWMFLTPIVYPAEMVPPRFRWVLAVNPLSYLVQAYRDVVLERRLPPAADVAVLAAISVAVFAAGHAVFRYTKHVLADLV